MCIGSMFRRRAWPTRHGSQAHFESQIPTPGKGLQDVGGLCCFHGPEPFATAARLNGSRGGQHIPPIPAVPSRVWQHPPDTAKPNPVGAPGGVSGIWPISAPGREKAPPRGVGLSLGPSISPSRTCRLPSRQAHHLNTEPQRWLQTARERAQTKAPRRGGANTNPQEDLISLRNPKSPEK